MSDLIFHLAEPDDWAQSIDSYSPPSLEKEAFIHCSTGNQLLRVARALYADHNNLVLLSIDPYALGRASLRYEDLFGVGEEFPHIYGTLPTSAVVSTGPYLTHLEEGLWLKSRFDRRWMDRILHPDYSEVGTSGKIHTREATMASTSREVDLKVRLPHRNYSLDLIDEDVALVRYISHDSLNGVERRALRCSIWVYTNQGWRLRFHQGTPFK